VERDCKAKSRLGYQNEQGDGFMAACVTRISDFKKQITLERSNTLKRSSSYSSPRQRSCQCRCKHEIFSLGYHPKPKTMPNIRPLHRRGMPLHLHAVLPHPTTISKPSKQHLPSSFVPYRPIFCPSFSFHHHTSDSRIVPPPRRIHAYNER
jgi:hypothetical protein